MQAPSLTRRDSVKLSAALILTLLVGLIARQLLEPAAGEAGPLLLLILVVMLGAWYGGLLPGLVATAFGALFAAYYFIEPIYSFAIAHRSGWLNLSLFILGGVVVSFLCEVRRRADEDRRAARQSEFQALAEANRIRAQLLRVNADLEQFTRMLERHLGQIGGANLTSFCETGASMLRYVQISRVTSPPETVDCEAVLRAALARCAPGLHDCGGNVLFDALPTVDGHEDQLVDLFSELIDNALKFRGTDRPKIRIASARVGDGWLFMVSDNGAGIEKSKWDEVFLPLQPGLGLATCRRIVENHNGRIWLDSIPNIGTTVRFTILRPPAPAAVRSYARGARDV